MSRSTPVPPLPDAVVTALVAAGRKAYEDAESAAAAAFEKAVASDVFGEVLAMTTTNAAALVRASNAALDRGVALLRLATTADVTRLAVQQNRTEDKLEALLQVVERLEERLDAAPADAAPVDATAARPSVPVRPRRTVRTPRTTSS